MRLLTCALFFFVFFSPASASIDSLLTAIKKTGQDTNRVKILNQLSNKYLEKNPDTARVLSEQALTLARSLKFKFGIADAKLSLSIISRSKGNYPEALKYAEEASLLFSDLDHRSRLAKTFSVIGSIYRNQSEYYKAIEYFKKSEELYATLDEKQSLSQLYNSFGVAYRHLGDFSTALEYYFKALKLNEEMSDKIGISKCYTNIGNIYGSKGEMQKTLEYHLKALEAASSVSYEKGASTALVNIALVYKHQAEYDKALEYLLRALPFHERTGNKSDLAFIYSVAGEAYAGKKDFPKALDYAQRSLDIRTEIGDKWGIVGSKTGFSNIKRMQGDVKEEIRYRLEALALAKEIGLLQETRDCHKELAITYEKEGQYNLSLEHFKEFKLYSDSLFNTGSADKLNQLQAKYDAGKREQEILLLKKDKEVSELESNKNKQKLYFLSGGVVLLVLLSGVVLSAYGQKRKANRLLAGQHKEIVMQKTEIEQKNKDITDSINYAKRIQEAILVSRDDLSGMFEEYFVLYQPRDIISGDFYWAHRTPSGKLMWAAADCTGHGVPGALMSMIGISLLNEIVGQNGIDDPGMVLNELRNGVINALQQKGEDHSVKDGMDIAICVLDTKSNVLEYAGAHNPLYIVRNDSKEVEEIKATKQAVGYSPGGPQPFIKHVCEMRTGDSVYIFSDGFADQFGGDKGKKFTYKRLKDMLLAIQKKPMREQEKMLSDVFRSWKKDEEQIDDVLVMGVRV